MSKRFLPFRQNGSSLIEVLVTMIIIAIGLLGQAALMAQSSKSSNSAFMRSQATLLSYDILERLRLNRALAIAGAFNTSYGVAAPAGTTIVAFELGDWKRNVAATLPAGDAKITVDGSGNAAINIVWDEVSKGGSTGNNCPGSNTNLTCFTTQSVI